MAVGSQCRDCSAPIEWRDTDQGRRPFDFDGRSHFASCSAKRRNGTTNSPAKDRTIARLTVLKAAANFAAMREEIKSADVLTIADRWLAWVEREGLGLEKAGSTTPAAGLVDAQRRWRSSCKPESTQHGQRS